MFDPELTREQASEDLGTERRASISTPLPRSIIDASRESNRLRNLCFLTPENYRRDFPQLMQALEWGREEIARWDVFDFLQKEMHVYMQAGPLQKLHWNAIVESTMGMLCESTWNAIEVSDHVQVGADVSPKGILLAVEQERDVGSAFIDRMKGKATELLERFKTGAPVQQILDETKVSMIRVIGCIPDDLQEKSMAIRGNGTAGMIANGLYRLNVQDNAMIALQNTEQLTHYTALQTGFRSVFPYVYGPRSALNTDTYSSEDSGGGNDDLFASGFTM